MRDRIAAQSVIEELLRQQQALPPRSRFARFWGRSPLAADSVAWYLCAQGEIEVGKILGRLPPEWRVFLALPVGAAGSLVAALRPGTVMPWTTHLMWRRMPALRPKTLLAVQLVGWRQCICSRRPGIAKAILP